jgi:hypothetical protein
MTDSSKNDKAVLILVRPAKRGYLVEAVGSGETYPCLTEADIGEAAIEILKDPNVAAAEFSPPPAEETASAPEGDGVVEGPDGYDEYDGDDNVRPNGWTAGDELAMNLIGSAADRLRKFSSWRNK